MNATPHHIGCAVRQLATSCTTYSRAFGLRRKTRSFEVASQRVRVCFLELGQHIYLELVEPIDGETHLESFLKTGFYHLCFLVENLGTTRERLRALRFAPIPEFASEAFGGALCQFFVSPQRHLIEVAQMSRTDFAAFFNDNLLLADEQDS